MGGGFVVESFCDLALDSAVFVDLLELLDSIESLESLCNSALDSVCDSADSVKDFTLSLRRNSIKLFS